MEFGFKTNHRKRMQFEHFIPPNMVFSRKEKMSTYSSPINFGNPSVIMDDYLIFNWPNKTQSQDFSVWPKKPAEGFPKKMSFYDPLSTSLLLVGGFVGSKSQAGGSSHRGSEDYSVWDVIRNFLPTENLKEQNKESPAHNFTQNQFEGVKGNVDRNAKSTTPVTAKKMNKSYAEVTKTGIIDHSSINPQHIKSTRSPIVSPQLEVVSANVRNPSPRTENAIPCNPILNNKPTLEEELRLKDCRVSNPRLNSFSSDSECSETTNNTSRKIRTLSDCSIDSDDSFIVFETNDEETGSVDSFSDEDSSSDENDEVDCCPSRTTRSLPEAAVTTTPSSCLNTVNSQWDKCYSTSQEKLPKKNSQKRVSFAKDKDLTKVQMIVVWDFAYRSARKGPWEELARDTARFKERIRRVESVLAPVLASAHRTAVYNQRFNHLSQQ